MSYKAVCVIGSGHRVGHKCGGFQTGCPGVEEPGGHLGEEYPRQRERLPGGGSAPGEKENHLLPSVRLFVPSEEQNKKSLQGLDPRSDTYGLGHPAFLRYQGVTSLSAPCSPHYSSHGGPGMLGHRYPG